MSASAKTPVDILLDRIDWQPVEYTYDVPDDCLYATHSGVLRIGDVELNVHRLNDGTRVFDADDVHALLGFSVKKGGE